MKEELTKSQMQKIKHLPENGQDIFSIHKRDKLKTLWYKSSWETMESMSVPTNRERVTYKSKIYPYHSIHKSVLTTILPTVNVKEDEQVTVSWCEDIFLSMIDNYRLTFNDTELQYGCGKLLYTEKNNIKRNSPKLLFASSVKSTPISIEVPFTYSQTQSDAFPLHLCGQNDRLLHLFQYNLTIKNLLVMKDADGYIIDTDMTKLNIESNYETIPVPELEGLYTTHVGNDGDFISDKNSIFITSAQCIEDDNEIQLGKRVKLKIDSLTNYPIEEVVWGAMNTTLTDKYLSCFTTTLSGATPVKSSKLESRSEVILDSKDSFKTEYVYNSDNYVEGISRWRNSICDSDGKKFSPGIVLSGGNLCVNTIDKDDDCKYVVFVILKYTKQYVFKSYPKTQAERLVKGATIELVSE